MARKNLIEAVERNAAATPSTETPPARPLAGLGSPLKASGAIGGISKTLGSINSSVERAREIEAQLLQGAAVIEIDTDLIDSSFVSDRLELDPRQLDELADQIREHGQQVPVLLRPHPTREGRYQVAYGHRRVAACQKLGIRVRAVVRSLTDEQLVVSQGQENNARANLSYIERALFAMKLEQRDFSREIIMSALGIDKAALSRMLQVAKQVPFTIVSLIGPAPSVGRRRWLELVDLLNDTVADEIIEVLSRAGVAEAESDERFELAFRAARQGKTTLRKDKPEQSVWVATDKAMRVSFSGSGKKVVVAIEAADAEHFAAFLQADLERLYASYRERAGEN
ncbi:plasmid partitioning protein RepB [Rhizobium lemnae]|uniref:Plasmid partitioning protein RepB n=1 Tax=Rhizobium lemnae TaxID=1214924 RepID=A0ABV8EBP2_9HYPH|nr:plasmid partitioning protein RepB [Rhizobium lemnae]MCJ8507060.1 plasmid partitioning protein RepB [Rhizobium lemnae]